MKKLIQTLAIASAILSSSVVASDSDSDSYVQDTINSYAKVSNANLNPLYLNAWINRYIEVVQRCYKEEQELGTIDAYLNSGKYCPWIISDTEFTATDHRMMVYYDRIKSNPKSTFEWLMVGDTQGMIDYKIIRETFKIRKSEKIKKICKLKDYKNSELC